VKHLFPMTLAVLPFLALACKKDDNTTPTGPNGGGGTPPTPTEIGTPILLTPPNGSTGVWPPIIFSWNAASNASRYELRAWYNLSTGGTGSLGASYGCGSGTSYTYTANLGSGFHGRTIYWYVRGKSSDCNTVGPWSEVRSFVLQ